MIGSGLATLLYLGEVVSNLAGFIQHLSMKKIHCTLLYSTYRTLYRQFVLAMTVLLRMKNLGAISKR
jgi:hypothetical protein